MNTQRKITAMLSLCACVGVSTLSAAPVSYDESLDGDLESYSGPIFNLDVGLNTFNGSSWIYGEDLEFFDWDQDGFYFDISPGQKLTAMTLRFDITKEQNSTWDLFTVPILSTLSSTIDDQRVLLSSPVKTPTSSPVDLFSHLLPLSEGTYSLSSGLGIGGEPYFNGIADIEYNYTLTLEVTSVSIPAAAWLFGSGLLGLIGIARKKAV